MSLDFVLSRTAPDTPATSLASVVLGLSPDAVRHALARRLLTSPEVRQLLDLAPEMLRSLANELTSREVLELGSISGPVVWPQTISARAANGFPSDLFVCRRAERSTDIPANRVLLHALILLERASRDLERYGTPLDEIPALAEVRALGRQARSFRSHRRLGAVTRPKGSIGDDVRLTLKSRNAKAYQPAIDVVRRHRRTLCADDLGGLVDRNTTLMCSIARPAVEVLDHLVGRPHTLEVHRGRLWAGPLSFAHPGPRTLERWPSVQIGERVIAISPPGERRQSPLTLEEQKRYADGEAPIVAVTDPTSAEDLALIRTMAERGLAAAAR